MLSAGACGPAPGPNHGASVPAPGGSNPRKFSEKIALHTQRQAEETAAFQEVMMDLTSTRIQAQKVRLARTQGPYYGSLPNVNQIGRTASELQGSFHSPLDSSRSTRHHGLVERVHRDRRFVSPSRPYRRQMDSSHSSSVYLSPPPDPSWRRNWNTHFPGDKSQIFTQLPTTALNRTNSDSALHTSVMNPPSADTFNTGLTAPGRRAAQSLFSYPVPPIEENGPDDGRLLKPWDSRKLPLLSSRPKSCEVPGITVFPSPDQQGGALHGPAMLNTGGSLPDLSSLHFPSPLPTPLDPDEPGFPSLSGGSSTGNLTCTLTQLGINSANAFSSSGLLQATGSSPSLQSSLSNPNIQSSLSSHSFPNSLSSASLHSSLSNPSIQSSLSSSPSLRSSLSSQSLQSSLSSSSLQSAASNPSYGGGGSGSFAPQMSTSPRRRAQPPPVSLPADTRRHHPKQFSPTSSTLSSITQGVALDTSKLQVDPRLSQYSFGQQQQQVQKGLLPTHHPSQTTQLHLHNMQNLQKTQNYHTQALQRPDQNLNPLSYGPAEVSQAEARAEQSQTLPPLQQISPNLSHDLDLYSDTMFLNSLLDDPYLSLQLTSRQNQNLNLSQQLALDSPAPTLNHACVSAPPLKAPGQQGALELLDSSEQHMMGQSQCQTYSDGRHQCQTYADGRHAVPNIILTGDSASGLSKEIASALSGVPGFEMDPFSSEDALALDGLGMLTDGDLMLADPAVEDSFRSDHLK